MNTRHYDIYDGASRSREHIIVAALVLLVIAAVSSVPILASRSVTQQAAQVPVVTAPVEKTEPAKVIEEAAPVVATPQIVDLQPVLDTWAAGHPKQQWGVSVKSLSGKEFQAELNSDKQFRSASLYKLFLVQPLFAKYSLAQQQTTSVKVGESTRSLASCVDVMLRLSDNPCGEAVAGKLGWTKVSRELKAAGYTKTDLSKADAIVTSAGDTTRYLEQLNGAMLDEASKAVVMNSLLKQKWNQGIPAGCPGCTVANKTGSIPSITHDAAIVQYAGGTYVITILSEGGTFKQIAELTAQIQAAINAVQ